LELPIKNKKLKWIYCLEKSQQSKEVMTTQTEQKIIEVIDKYIVFMLTIQDEEQYIFSKMNEIEEEELGDWVNDYLLDYLANSDEYRDDDKVISDCSMSMFSDIDLELLLTESELLEIKTKLLDICFEEESLSTGRDIIENYKCWYIQNMDENELKEYITNLVEPIQPK
jgi:hypothetical protein